MRMRKSQQMGEVMHVHPGSHLMPQAEVTQLHKMYS